MNLLGFVAVSDYYIMENGIIRCPFGGWLCGEPWDEAVRRARNEDEPYYYDIYLMAPIIKLGQTPSGFQLTGDGWQARSAVVVSGPWKHHGETPLWAAWAIVEAYKSGCPQISRILAWAIASLGVEQVEYRDEFALLLKEQQEEQAPPPPPLLPETLSPNELRAIIYDRSRNIRERIEAVRLLPRCGREKKVVDIFWGIFFGGAGLPDEIRREAAKQLSEIGEDALPILEAIIRGGRLLPEALEAAAEIGEAAIHIIRGGLASQYLDMKIAAVQAAVKIGKVEILEEALDVPNFYLWAEVMEAAGQLRCWTIVQRGLEDLNRYRRNVRVASIRAAGYFGEAVIPLLEAALEEENREIREAAIDAAGKIGPAALHIVERGLGDNDPHIRNRALEVLKGWGECTLPFLERVVSSESVHWIRSNAYWAAMHIASTTDVTPFIIRGLDDPNPDVRLTAARVAVKIGRPAARAIFAALKSPDRDVRLSVLIAFDADRLADGFLKAVRADPDDPYTALLARAVYEYETPLPPTLPEDVDWDD